MGAVTHVDIVQCLATYQVSSMAGCLKVKCGPAADNNERCSAVMQLLPCGHRLCENCFDNTYPRGTKRLQCLFCRKPFNATGANAAFRFSAAASQPHREDDSTYAKVGLVPMQDSYPYPVCIQTVPFLQRTLSCPNLSSGLAFCYVHCPNLLRYH